MGTLIKEIDALYDTWIGRWKATRQFLTTLRNVCFEIKACQDKQDRDTSELWTAVRNLRIENEDLKAELAKKLSAPKDSEGFATANRLMDKFYESQKVTN